MFIQPDLLRLHDLSYPPHPKDRKREKGIVDVEKVRMKANSLLKKAQKLENDKRFADAIERYKQVVSLPTTEYTRMARMALDRLREDPFVQDAIARAGEETEAQSLLRRAQMWERNNLEDKAAELYRKVIDEYPDTTAVEEAFRELRKLRRLLHCIIGLIDIHRFQHAPQADHVVQ